MIWENDFYWNYTVFEIAPKPCSWERRRFCGQFLCGNVSIWIFLLKSADTFRFQLKLRFFLCPAINLHCRLIWRYQSTLILQSASNRFGTLQTISERFNRVLGGGGLFFKAILRKSSKMIILRISGIFILYHIINITILEWNRRFFVTWQNRYFQRP